MDSELNTIHLTRSKAIHKIPEKWLEDLEDKQFHWVVSARREAWEVYRQRRFWPLLLTWAFGWLLLPLILWGWYRRTLPEWQQVQKFDLELQRLQEARQYKAFWKKVWPKKNLLRSESFEAIHHFYHSLLHTAQQYNIRVDLFDYALDRQNKRLDPPFTVGELEEIELTFQRIFAELSSAIKLLEVAEQHPHMDLATLLKDQYQGLHQSTDYLSHSVDLAHTGQFAQELLVLETSLRQEIQQMTRHSSSNRTP